MSQNFKLFRLKDLLMFGAACSLPTFALIYSILHGLTGQPLAMLITVTACFWGLYGLFLYNRQRFLNKITFITKHKIAIIANGFTVKQSDIELLTDDSINKWNTACNFDRSAKAVEGLWVEFKPFPITDHAKLGNLAGYTVGQNCVIGWKENIAETAFQHELGHEIHHEFTGAWSNDACHKFMSNNQLL